MKKVLIIGAVLVLVVGMVGAAGLVYVGYRVKNRIEKEVAQEAERHREAGRPSAITAEAAVHRIDACTLLTKEEATEILGVTIERVESKQGTVDSSCLYFAKARSQQERAASVADAFKAMSDRGAEPMPSIGPNEAYKAARQTGVADLMKQVGALAGPADGPYVGVTVTWENARTSLQMLRVVAGANAPGVKATEDLSGIGDDAVMGPADSMLAFVKGQTGVQIGLTQVPQGRDKGVAMARKIASRL